MDKPTIKPKLYIETVATNLIAYKALLTKLNIEVEIKPTQVENEPRELIIVDFKHKVLVKRLKLGTVAA